MTEERKSEFVSLFSGALGLVLLSTKRTVQLNSFIVLTILRWQHRGECRASRPSPRVSTLDLRIVS